MMKRYSVVILLAAVASASLKAQDAGKWSVGLSVSPDLCYRTLKNTTDDPVRDGIIEARNESEHFKLGFTVGVNARRDINKRLSFETGLLYSNKGYLINSTLVFGNQVDPMSGAGDATTRYSYLYADLPLKINVGIINKERTVFYITTGMVFNVFLQQRSVTTISFPDGSKDVTRSTGEPFYENNPLNISVFGGFGIRRQLSEHLDMQIEPVFRYGLFPLFESPIEGFLWNYGLNAAVYYRL